MQSTALDVAQAAGLYVKQKGTRAWTCCPIHSEKTPSLCFFPDGRWYCFGCHTGGDAADMYVALHHVPLGEALRKVKHDLPEQPAKGALLRRKVEQWKAAYWHEALTRLHWTNALMEKTPPNSDAFWEVASANAKAQDLLNLLESATPRQLLEMMRGTE